MKMIFQDLNDIQNQAVLSESSRLLILAGAGTGKTRVITSKIIYLLKEKRIRPENILAVTFTNKAANEMRERVLKEFDDSIDLLIKTFHSFGSYILRQESFLAGRNRYFQVYDTDDSIKLLNKILKKFEVSTKKSGLVHKWIQNYKQKVEDYSAMDYKDNLYVEIYEEYNKALKEANCFDFEDLILEPVKIFSSHPDIRKKYRSRFKYILVDEYQDTNKSQFELLKLLADEENNITVVGDEDQSIYKFRGADINNILDFGKSFTETEIVRLEENYRSTSIILKAANAVIANNSERLGKNLFTNSDKGSKISVLECYNEIDEVEKIVYSIESNGMKFGDSAILYRTNNQSRAFEQYFNKNKIPYIIYGSIKFFDREEIKDIISILKWLVNPKDGIAFSRFVNKPRRGIGDKSLEGFLESSKAYENILSALENVENTKGVTAKSKESLKELCVIFKDKDRIIKELPIDKIILYYLEMLDLFNYYKEQDDKDGSDKLDNIKELVKSVEERGSGEEALLSFLEEVVLSNPIDSDPEEFKKSIKDRIKLMTVHNAKGLEFENVFIAGVEKELFPHINSYEDDDLEEERRLFYVAVTRAKKNLTVSFAKKRNLFGLESYQMQSQFIDELPEELLDYKFKVDNNGYVKNIDFAEGDIVKHSDYGKGRIVLIKKINGKHYTQIDFWDNGIKEFVLEHTLNKLDKADD